MNKNLKQVDRRRFIGNISKAGIFGTLASLLPGTSSARILDAYSADPDKGHIFFSEPQAGNRTLIRVQADQKDLHLEMLLDNGMEVGKLHLTV